MRFSRYFNKLIPYFNKLIPIQNAYVRKRGKTLQKKTKQKKKKKHNIRSKVNQFMYTLVETCMPNIRILAYAVLQIF